MVGMHLTPWAIARVTAMRAWTSTKARIKMTWWKSSRKESLTAAWTAASFGSSRITQQPLHISKGGTSKEDIEEIKENLNF